MVRGQIWPNFKLIQALMNVIITCSMRRIPSRTTEKKWQHRVSNYNTTSGRIWPNFEPIKALVYVIITCKYEKDPLKNSREKVETSFFHYKPMGNFSGVRGQLIPQSVVQSGRNSNSSELLCMSSLPASMKRNR